MSNRFTLRSSTGFLDVVLESDPVQRQSLPCESLSATSRRTVLSSIFFVIEVHCIGDIRSWEWRDETLVDATENFSDGNKIGQGSFGCVYKGQLHDGLEVAVKRCFELPCSRNQMDFQDLEFQNEICFLGKLQHTNVVKLLGYCIQGTERILVYECKNKKVASGLVYTLSDN
uniref:Protein kinase domain-containing protein n=1 Tax=Oryza rufipogon TaxID=4529 RepID=A0A0E0NBK6_ORYRU